MFNMPIEKLLGALLVKKLEGRIQGVITGLAYHSGKVSKGNLFFALPGTRAKGWEYAREAMDRGAVAVVVEENAPSLDLPCIRVPHIRRAMAVLAETFYGYPSRRLRLVGVTGTNGKTTTTNLINTLYERRGIKTGLIGTIEYKIGKENFETLSTTPESVDLQFLFHTMLQRGVTHAVMEVSSHALELQRVAGCEYDVAVLTNITEDHLDFHGDFNSYLAAKTKLFTGMGGSFRKNNNPRVAVLNGDDPNYPHVAAHAAAQVITYGVRHKADVFAEDPVIDQSGSAFRVRTYAGDFDLELHLRGMFNVYNALGAVAVGLVEGMDPGEIKEALEKVTGIPGRFEQVEAGQDYMVIVDYAHTPDGLENVLRTARQLLQRGKILTVFGCGGERDRTKRPLMGEIAGRYSEICIVTSDNPRREDPEAIIREIIPGLEKEKSPTEYSVKPDRAEAIRKAVVMACPGDIVIIAGKGHEEYQIFADKTVPFSDREVVREAIREQITGKADHGKSCT